MLVRPRPRPLLQPDRPSDSEQPNTDNHIVLFHHSANIYLVNHSHGASTNKSSNLVKKKYQV
jgi:hypothetical protein